MSIVIDASVAIAWRLQEKGSTLPDEAIRHAVEHGGFVPQLWSLEVANILIIHERKGRLNKSEVHEAFYGLQELQLGVDEVTSSRAFGPIAVLASEQRLTVYDAAYLELARRLNVPLASLDKELNRAEKAIGVELFGARVV